MTHPLSDRINSLPVSQTLAMAAKARELKAAGKDIISLSLGEPDFNTPEFIKNAAIEAINQNYSSYSPVDGYVELKEAIPPKKKTAHLSKMLSTPPIAPNQSIIWNTFLSWVTRSSLIRTHISAIFM